MTGDETEMDLQVTVAKASALHWPLEEGRRRADMNFDVNPALSTFPFPFSDLTPSPFQKQQRMTSQLNLPVVIGACGCQDYPPVTEFCPRHLCSL